jgi:hypothetical protein
MSITHFVDLLFSFQRPNPASDSLFVRGTVFLLQGLVTVKKNFEEFFSRFSVSPVGSSTSFPAARALYLTTPALPVNRKNLLPVDFFRGPKPRASEGLFSRSPKTRKGLFSQAWSAGVGLLEV